jgi:diphthamide biosynthesis protein 2
MSTVSASGVEAIEKTIEVEPLQQISDTSIEEIYDVQGTAHELLKGGWKRVCYKPSQRFPVRLADSADFPASLYKRYAYNSQMNCCTIACPSSKLFDLDWRIPLSSTLWQTQRTEGGCCSVVTGLGRSAKASSGDSCCVDEVAAQHVDAQVVVHYGHACLSA